jgi:hypothetical protein
VDVHLDTGAGRVYGKGSATSAIPGPGCAPCWLLPWTREALDAWLQERSDSLSQWLFPFSKKPDRHMTVMTYGSIVQRRIRATFPDPQGTRDQMPKLHAFCPWFVTRCHQHGVGKSTRMIGSFVTGEALCPDARHATNRLEIGGAPIGEHTA